MTVRTRWLLVALGAMLVIGAPAGWYLSQPAPTVGELPQAFIVEPDEDAAPTPEPAPAPEPAPEETVEEPADEPVEEPEPEPVAARPPRPVSVSIPSIGVDGAEVVEVGLDDNRAVEIPDDVSQVGWYNRGPRPGEDGNAFMTSHIDSRTQGRGVLYDLRRSEPGDLIVVTHDDGSVTEWEVVHRERIVKGSYPMDRVFRFEGPPGLVIDTCGGPFNPSTGSYENIDIVYAVPLGADYDSLEAQDDDR